MANPESFLEEVAEEVRRDRLFRFKSMDGCLYCDFACYMCINFFGME